VRPKDVAAMAREHTELVASLRALCAVMREGPADVVLSRILDAELHQLAVLGGEMLADERIGGGRPGPIEEIDIARELHREIRQTGRIIDIEVRGRVLVEGHPLLVRQAISSALAFAHRVADGVPTATAYAADAFGSILIGIPVHDDGSALRNNARLGILHRIARAEGGRMRIERSPAALTIRLAFPAPQRSADRSTDRGVVRARS